MFDRELGGPPSPAMARRGFREGNLDASEGEGNQVFTHCVVPGQVDDVRGCWPKTRTRAARPREVMSLAWAQPTSLARRPVKMAATTATDPKPTSNPHQPTVRPKPCVSLNEERTAHEDLPMR
jgi:hypothetical protein